MPFHIFPLITTISELASTTWEIYSKAKHASTAKRDKQVHESLMCRVEELEEANLEQARLISALSRELDQFAQAVEDELEARQSRERRLSRIVYVAVGIATVALALSVLNVLGWNKIG